MLPLLMPTISYAGNYVAPDSPTSTQWRLLFPSGTTTNNPTTSIDVEIYEVEMRATSGGADQCTGGTASASSEFSGSFVASRAFDNNTGTQWASTNAGNNGSWLQYTFASAVAVNEVTVKGNPSTGPTSLRLQYYDGSTWQTYIESAGPLSWSSGETKTFTYSAPFAEAGYDQWRIFIVTGASGSEMDINEVEMRASSGGADRCFGGTATAINSFDGNRAPTKAFDNSTSGFSWVPSTPITGSNTWLAYQFWRKEEIAEFTIRSSGTTGPRQVKLQYYDGSTWQDAYTSASGMTWGSPETKTFTI